ncbi:uncharacterized protein [Anabrus simplex]|uniref:uncharacterized protein isoform X2 n=1 Tax=Anabrus simplex TaxID=316456 RepID=UPI0035A3D4FA
MLRFNLKFYWELSEFVIVMSSEGDECYLPTHMLEVSIVEEKASTDLQELYENVGEDHTYCRLSDVREDHTYCLPNLHNVYDHCVNGTDELKRRVNMTEQNTHAMECTRIKRKLDESELEELNAFIPFIPDVFLESDEDDKETEPVEINHVTSRIRKKRDGIPVLPTSPEELEFYSKLFEDVGVVRYLRIHCTICDCHIGCCPESINIAFRHRVLGVLVCKQCYVFYGEGNFPQGDDDSEIYCRWCGQGGRLLCCSSCPCTFCKKCLMRNFTKKAKLEFENRIDWECFVCNPRYIWEHRAFCWAVIKYIQKENEDWKCGIESGGVIYGPKIPASGDDPSVCCEGIHENSKATSHRRISIGLPEEERLKMFVQAAIRLRNLDRNFDKTLVSQLDSEMWNVVNHVPRIKARDISELTGEKQSNDTELLSQILNPISAVNSTNVTNANVCSPLPPMVQIPTKSLPPYHVVSGQQEMAPQILPLINPCNPVNSPRSSATDSAPFGQYIVKAINTTSNNVVRLPVATSSQVDNTKVNYYPNPMAVVPNSQSTSYSSPFLTSLSQGAGVFVRGLQGTNPRPLTKIAIVNGQAVPNRPGFFYINSGQKRFIAPVLQPMKRVLRLPAVPQNGPILNNQPSSAASITSSNNYTVMTKHHTDTEDDDVRIISSTSPASKSEGHNVRQFPKAANTVPLFEKVNSSPQNEIIELASSDKPQNEKNAVSGQGNCLSDITSQGTDSLQLNTSSNISFCRQLKKSLEDVDEISRNMSTYTLLMKKMYKRLVKQRDFTGLEKVAKRLRRLLKKNIQKMCIVDTRVLTELGAFIKVKTSAEIGENPSKNSSASTVNLDSVSEQDDDFLSALEKDVHMDWNSSDSDDDITFTEHKSGKKNVSVNLLATKRFETEKITPKRDYSRHQTKSPSKSNSLLKRSLLQDRYIPEPKTESPRKDKICSSYLGNVEAAEHQDVSSTLEKENNSEGSPIKCPLSPSELKKSMSCTVPIKLKLLDAEATCMKKRKRNSQDLPNSKRRNSQARANIFKEAVVPIERSNDIHNIPVEWTKLIRPCSVVLVRIDNGLLRKQESKTV